MVSISNFRLSLIWSETIPAILEGKILEGKIAEGGLSIGRSGDLAKMFEACVMPNNCSKNLQRPWKYPVGHNFWRFYFEGKRAGTITGAQAWKKLVPLRYKPPFKVIMERCEAKISLEVFYASHGLGLIATANYRGTLKPLREIAVLAQMVKDGRYFRISTSDTSKLMTLSEVAEHALDLARIQAFGNVEAFPGINQPFTIASFIQGANIENGLIVNQGDGIHRILEAVTDWNPYFEKMSFTDINLNDYCLPIKKRLDSDIVYARKTGRAIWFPRALTGTLTGTKSASSVSCYHRNLVIGSFLVQSLGEFVRWTTRRYRAGSNVAQALLNRARRAATLLTHFSEGKYVIYRSASLQTQIADYDLIKDIKFLRDIT